MRILLAFKVITTDVVGDLVEVRDAAQTVGRVVRQADVEEAAVLLGHELVHIAAAGPDEQQVIASDELRIVFFGRNSSLCLDKLSIFIVRQLVVAVFRLDLVVLLIFQSTEHELEVDRHIGVVVQGHLRALLDEEHDEAVVVVALDGDSVKVRLEVVRIGSRVLAGDAQLVDVDRIHALDEVHSGGVAELVVQEVDAMARLAGLDAHVLDLVSESFHGRNVTE